jgi:hypothetical protein
VYRVQPKSYFAPPHTITFEPVHTMALEYRPSGAPVVEVGVHVFATGSYLPPVFV